MKARLLLLLFVPAVAAGQTRPPVQVGLDVAKLLLTTTNGRPLLRQVLLIEPIIKVPLNDRRTLIIQPGYARALTDTVNRNVNRKADGFYLKMGIEYQIDPSLMLGWQGLLSVYNQSGSFTFPGPTFGNYVESLPVQPRVMLGLETYFGREIRLSNRFNLRATGRLGFGLTGGNSSAEPPPRYVPGLGLCVGRTFVVGAGLGVQLLYRAGRTVRPANPNP